MSTDPNVGPITALGTAFLSALMVVLDAFNVFHITAAQQGDVIGLAATSMAVGLYLFAVLHQKTALVVTAAALAPPIAAAPAAVPPAVPPA